MRVAITGAAGNIGRQLIEELSSNHELRLIDRRPIPGRSCWQADLTKAPFQKWWRIPLMREPRSWRNAFKGCDVVVHLAAIADSLAPWEKVAPDNIRSTWNVIEAAAANQVPRVVFASSNWAVKGEEYNLAPDCYLPNGPKISFDAPPSPVNAYGLSKTFGEMVGRMFVDQGKLQSFVSVRIGNFNAEPAQDPVLRSRWIGTRDIRDLMRRCIEEKFQSFQIVYGVSAQPEAPYDLSFTRNLLCWEPKQAP